MADPAPAGGDPERGLAVQQQGDGYVRCHVPVSKNSLELRAQECAERQSGRSRLGSAEGLTSVEGWWRDRLCSHERNGGGVGPGLNPCDFKSVDDFFGLSAAPVLGLAVDVREPLRARWVRASRTAGLRTRCGWRSVAVGRKRRVFGRGGWRWAAMGRKRAGESALSARAFDASSGVGHRFTERAKLEG
jgi:hypothetical protein